MSISQRKKDHLDITASGRSGYDKTTGFERFDFVHNALPEVDLDEIICETKFLHHHFSFPLFISSMTGGHAEAGAVNEIIAVFCERFNIPFGIGSQRILLEDPQTVESFAVVREKAPTAFIASNIGATRLLDGFGQEQYDIITGTIRADAIIVHLNPLQELMQPEGDRNFKGVREGIRRLVSDFELPVIVKETGAGLSRMVAEELIECGVAAIDVAGSGGTSWARVENLRTPGEQMSAFDNWGIPTADCLQQLGEIENLEIEILASGGIRSSFDVAKSLCLGAGMAATAQPVIEAVIKDGYDGLEALFTKWEKELKIILCLLGCERPSNLSYRHLRAV